MKRANGKDRVVSGMPIHEWRIAPSQSQGYDGWFLQGGGVKEKTGRGKEFTPGVEGFFTDYGKAKAALAALQEGVWADQPLQRPKRGPVAAAIHINNTGRTVFNREAVERIGQPQHMAVIFDGNIIRLIPVKEAGDNTLPVRYTDGGHRAYMLSTPDLYKPLGFDLSVGDEGYLIDPKPYGDDGFEFPSPF